jgi:hypothetical protein
MGFLTAFQKKPLSDAAHAVEKFTSLLERFLDEPARGAGLRDRSITLIARSPAMGAVRALTLYSDEIERRQIGVQVVFAKLSPVEPLVALSSALKLVDPQHPASGRIRFIKNAALLDAHEQFVLGRAFVWTGDMLRRPDDQRNRLDIIEEGAAEPIRLAELSFHAIWSVSKPIPARALTGHPLVQPYASVSPAFAAAGLAGDKVATVPPGVPAHTRH